MVEIQQGTPLPGLTTSKQDVKEEARKPGNVWCELATTLRNDSKIDWSPSKPRRAFYDNAVMSLEYPSEQTVIYSLSLTGSSCSALLCCADFVKQVLV